MSKLQFAREQAWLCRGIARSVEDDVARNALSSVARAFEEEVVRLLTQPPAEREPGPSAG